LIYDRVRPRGERAVDVASGEKEAHEATEPPQWAVRTRADETPGEAAA